MADDYSIRARITGDASEFKVAMDSAAASTEQNIARIKKSLEEAKVALAGYAAQIKANSTIDFGGTANQKLPVEEALQSATGGLVPIVAAVKAQLEEAKAGFQSTQVKIADLEAQLRGLPAATEAASGGFAFTKRQLELMAAAVESAQRQLLTLPKIQAEVAASVNASVAEMAAVRKRADAEVAQSAKILSAIQVSGVAESGDIRGQQALTQAVNAHVQALQVQQEVQAKQAAVTAEAAAREELLARATAQSTTATAAESEAQVQASIAKEGSAVAALKVADAQEATLSGAQKQAAAIVNADQIIQRSQTAVAGLQAEVANQTGISAERMQTYVQRAAAEVQKANAAIKASQLALGEAITEGNAGAIASMAALQEAAVNAAVVFDNLKGQQADIAAAQQATADAAAQQAAALDVVSQVTTAAAERGQNFVGIQQEIAASVGKTSVELESTYVRAAAAARVATTALVSDSQRLAPAIQQGLPGADAALATLRSQMQQTRIAAEELAARIKLVELAEAEATPTAQADALAQFEVAIAEKGSAVAALEAELAARKLAEAQEQVAGSSNVARVGIAEMTGSTQGMIFALSRVLAAVPGVQVALQYAFPVITAIAFIDILGEMSKKLVELIEDFQGFGKEEQKRIDDVNHAIEDSFNKYISLRDKIAETHSIGLTGIPKLNSESLEASTTLQDLKDHMGRVTDEAEKLQKAIDKVDYSKNVAKAPGHALEEIETTFLKRNTGVQISEKGTYDDTEKALTKAEADKRETQEKINTLEVQQDALKYEKQEAAFHRDVELQERGIAKTRDFGLAEAAELKKRAEAEYAAGQIDADQKADLLTTALEQRYQIEQTYAAKHDALQARLAAKGETPSYINESIDQERRRVDRFREIDEVDKTRARDHKAELNKINEEHVKQITDKLPEVEEAAPEGHGKQAGLAFLQTQQEAIQKLPKDDLEEYQKAIEYLAKAIPRLMGEASKETEKSVKDSVDEQYHAWERGGQRTATQILQFWSLVRAQATEGSALAKEADEKITAQLEKFRENTRKVNEDLQKRNELEREHADDIAKANIQRNYVGAPPTSLNPFAATPQQQEKQELGNVELDRIRQRIDLNLQQQAEEKRDNQDSLDRYAKLQNDKLKLDNEYYAKKAALDNQKLQDEYQNYLKYYEQISGAFLKGIDGWILGQQRFSVAMFNAWRGIVTEVVHDIEQITAKWIESHLIMKALGGLFNRPQFNQGAGPGHGYGPATPPGFGNGGLLGTGQVPLAGGGSDLTLQQSTAAKEDALRQQQLQKYILFNRQKLSSDQTTAAQSTLINAQQNAQQTAADVAAKQAQVAVTAQAEAEEMGLTATGAAESATVEKTANATSILGAAKKRYAQVSANEGLNSIPFVGPAIAQAAGVAAFAATLAFLDTGGYVPKQGIAMLHPGEVVVNHPVTSLLSNIAARGGVDGAVGAGSGNGGSQQSSGGDTHVHFSPQIHAVDSAGVGRLLEQHGKQFVRYLKAQNRNGRLA